MKDMPRHIVGWCRKNGLDEDRRVYFCPDSHPARRDRPNGEPELPPSMPRKPQSLWQPQCEERMMIDNKFSHYSFSTDAKEQYRFLWSTLLLCLWLKMDQQSAHDVGQFAAPHFSATAAQVSTKVWQLKNRWSGFSWVLQKGHLPVPRPKLEITSPVGRRPIWTLYGQWVELGVSPNLLMLQWWEVCIGESRNLWTLLLS